MTKHTIHKLSAWALAASFTLGAITPVSAQTTKARAAPEKTAVKVEKAAAPKTGRKPGRPPKAKAAAAAPAPAKRGPGRPRKNPK